MSEKDWIITVGHGYLSLYIRTHYHRMISELVHQVVMDRRGSVSVADFSSTFGVSVGNLIEKFSELDRLHEMEAEASQIQERAIRLAAENKELKLELEHWRSQSGGQAAIPPQESSSVSRRKSKS